MGQTIGATTSKDQLRPLNSRQSLPVLGEVADGRPMVSADLRWSLVVFGGRCDHLVIEVFGASLHDQMVAERYSVVFNQSFMGRRLPYDSFQ